MTLLVSYFILIEGKLDLWVSVLAEKLNGTLSTFFFFVTSLKKTHGEVSFVPHQC